jgi:hydrogenase maturation protease
MRVLVGGVGYHNLSDHSVGPLLVERFQRMSWPRGVDIRDLSFNHLGFVQEFLGDRLYYDRVVLVGAVPRGGPPGQVRFYRWAFRLPPEAELQNRIAEAYMGVISLENLLVIGTHFDIWPLDVRVFEVEPAWETWGGRLSPQVEDTLPRLLTAVREEVLAGWAEGWARARAN